MDITNGTAEILSYRFSFHELEISRSRLESLMGYEAGAAPEPLPRLIDGILFRAADYCDIQGGFMIKDNPAFNSNDRLLTVGNVTFTLRDTVYNQVQKAGRIAVFACTSGPGISDWSRELMAGEDPAAGYIVDQVGSVIVETAMDRMHADLSGRMTASGLQTSNRYSPGYCGWDVSEQHKLFSLLPDNFCGIQLSDTALMLPVKSVSGIIGIGKDIRYNPYTCNSCDSHNCPYRNRKPRGVIM